MQLRFRESGRVTSHSISEMQENEKILYMDFDLKIVKIKRGHVSHFGFVHVRHLLSRYT